MGLNDIFKALSDETRRKILAMLSEKDLTAGEIAGRFSQSWPTISHHLEVLEKAGLITSQRDGRNIIYSLNVTVFDEVLSFIFNATKKGGNDGDLQNK
jgi:DNA-binding transcriptional ArsR family regulator